ncbi:LacI family transcriptional regulator [Prolixibacteraceae bacterium JC049]|nr:LacI family transcriptional regulator [Prolixibacteraceae bacterium JC049]
MQRVTIKDIAKKLNLSKSSVSRAFNDKYDIKKETRDLILKTAEEMGYFPNPIARKLSQSKTYNIGVVVPEFINDFHAEIIIGIHRILNPKGYQVLVMQSDSTPEMELKNVQTLIQNMVDGLIIAPSSDSDNLDYYLKQMNAGTPMVFVNRIAETFEAPKVVCDNKKWSFFATEHLIREKYKKIYHLSGNKNISVARDRIKGFKQALRKHQFAEEDFKVIETGLLASGGVEVVEELLYRQDLPDAFFCINDLVAMGVIRTLKKNNIRVPEEIGVIGFSETQMAKLTSPQLSSVQQPTYEMGEKAAELLIRHMNDEEVKEATIVLNGKLNIRESSKRS